MQHRSLAAFGLGATAAAATCALLTTGVVAEVVAGVVTGGTASARKVGGAIDELVLPRAAAAAQGLPAFEGCEKLRRWYVEAALPQVGPWGFDGGRLRRGPVPVAGAADVRADASSESAAVGSSDTGTNVQEGGVDEPDIAKTDGRVVVRVVGDHLVIDDVRGSRPRRLSRIELPGRPLDRELLLVGSTVLVVGNDFRWGYRGPALDDVRGPVPWGGDFASTHLTEVDISDPGAPVTESNQRVDGELVAAREYGDGTVRVVVETGYPVLDFVTPNRDRSIREARRLNREIVRRAAVEDWLPGLRRGDGNGRQPLLGCTDVRHPHHRSGFGTISTLTMDIEEPLDLDATAITAAGDLVYSSADRLYVATLRTSWWDDVVQPGARVRTDRPRTRLPETTVHAFALGDRSTTYVASGSVPGTVRDRWSFDEHDGLLRVATAIGRGWSPRENAVSVLEQTGDTLRVVGSVGGLGRGEQIESVRWFDDLAVVVTFRQTDPLYTIDLSSPRSPTLLGALKIRGFSAYLHPVGDDLVLGLGQDATRQGLSLGGQVATFDLGDLEAVTREDSYRFGHGTDVVDSDPRAFTYLPDERLGFVAVEDWRSGHGRLAALRVGVDGSLTKHRTWRLDRWSGPGVRTLPLGDGRVVILDRSVRIADVR